MKIVDSHKECTKKIEKFWNSAVLNKNARGHSPESRSLEYITSKQIKTYSVDKIRKDYPRAYEKWTPNEDKALAEQFKSGITISQLAKMHQRKIGAIRSRLRKLGLLAE
jgi:hypothetical protein